MQIAPAASAVVAALIVFAIGIVLHWRNWLGGGDIKLITATALLLGGDGDDILQFLFLMSLIGSGLAVLLLIHLRVNRRRAAAHGAPASDDASDHAQVPYAVAVALAATILLFLQSQRA